jgi:hypothetical protein
MRHHLGRKLDRGIGDGAQDAGIGPNTVARDGIEASVRRSAYIDSAAQRVDRRSIRERSRDIHIQVDLALWKCILALPSPALSVVSPTERHQDDLAPAVG